MALTVNLALFGVMVLVALSAVELQRPRLFALAKPLATLLLVPMLGLPPTGVVRALVCCGVLLSLAGDLALIGTGAGALMAGLVFFLGAHLVYTTVFVLGNAAPIVGSSWAPVIPILVFGLAAVWLLRALWPRLSPGLRLPVVIYAAALSAMAATAMDTLLGGWPLHAAVAATAGATLFFLSDAALAWNQFRQPIPHGQTLTLSLYWAAQLGIVLGARFSG